MKKTALLAFKVSPETKKAYEKFCDSNHTNPSHELRKFVLNELEPKKQ